MKLRHLDEVQEAFDLVRVGGSAQGAQLVADYCIDASGNPTSCYIMSCYSMQCHVMLFYVILCYVEALFLTEYYPAHCHICPLLCRTILILSFIYIITASTRYYTLILSYLLLYYYYFLI